MLAPIAQWSGCSATAGGCELPDDHTVIVGSNMLAAIPLLTRTPTNHCSKLLAFP